MNRYFSLGALVAASTVVLSAQAQQAMDDVVVTAARVAQPINEVIGSVTVITREQIEQRQSQSLQELLRGEAGIEITNTGGLGKLSNVFVRGANSTQTLILIDGLRVGSATSGTTRTELIPLDQIDHIEIVRGPRSSLYGADAMGGVIQIFTRKNNGVNASVSVARYNTQTYSAGFGLNEGGLRASVQGGYQQSTGFNSCMGSFSDACFTVEPDDDGYRNSNVSARVGYDFGMVDMELSTLYAKGMTEYDGSFGNQTHFSSSTPSARVRINASEQITVTLQGGVSNDKNYDTQDGVFASRFYTQRRNAGMQVDWAISPAHTLTGGADYLEDKIDSETVYDITNRDNKGVYVQYLGKVGAQELSASARHDDNEQFGSKKTGSLGWKWFVMGDAFALNAGIGNAFHAPSFNELYYPSDDYTKSNPNLKPETSRNYELGVSGRQKTLTWSVQAYRTEVANLIIGAVDMSDFKYTPNNASEARLQGLEVMLSQQWNQLHASINYTAQQALNLSPGADYRNQLPRRSRHTGRIDVGYDFGGADVAAVLNATGKRYDNLANTKPLGGYATLDLRTNVKLPANLGLQFKLANLFNRQYQTTNLYNEPGRTWSVTVRYPQ